MLRYLTAKLTFLNATVTLRESRWCSACCAFVFFCRGGNVDGPAGDVGIRIYTVRTRTLCRETLFWSSSIPVAARTECPATLKQVL